MTLYIKVTKDEYELPIAVAENVVDLAKMVGCSVSTIYSSISHAKSGKQYSPYKKIVVEENDDD